VPGDLDGETYTDWQAKRFFALHSTANFIFFFY